MATAAERSAAGVDKKAMRPPGSKHFAKGHPGGPGRPKGSVSGRKGIIQMMDSILEDPDIKKQIATAMVAEIMAGNKKALAFLQAHVYPNTPKESIIEVKDNTEGRNGVRIVMSETTGEAVLQERKLAEESAATGDSATTGSTLAPDKSSSINDAETV